MLSALRTRGRDAALDADVEDRGPSADETLHKELAEHELQTLIKDLAVARVAALAPTTGPRQVLALDQETPPTSLSARPSARSACPTRWSCEPEPNSMLRAYQKMVLAID